MTQAGGKERQICPDCNHPWSRHLYGFGSCEDCTRAGACKPTPPGEKPVYRGVDWGVGESFSVNAEPPAGEGEARLREVAREIWNWCWARTVNLALPDEPWRVVTQAEAPDETPAIARIAALLASEREGLERERDALQERVKAYADADRIFAKNFDASNDPRDARVVELQARVEALERELREARDGLVLGQKVRAEMAGKMERERVAHQEEMAALKAAHQEELAKVWELGK